MSKTVEERLDLMEKIFKKHKQAIAEQNTQIENIWTALRRIGDRTDKLRTAVPHVPFQDW